MDQDTVALAEHLDWTHARARPAENVLREDRLGRGPEIARGYLERQRGRRRPPGSRRRRVPPQPTALEAAVRLMRASGAVSGGRSSRARSSAKPPMSEVCAGGSLAPSASAPTRLRETRVFRNRLRRRAEAAVALAVRSPWDEDAELPTRARRRARRRGARRRPQASLSAAEASARLARSGRSTASGPAACVRGDRPTTVRRPAGGASDRRGPRLAPDR